jgi:hypothetical protein
LLYFWDHCKDRAMVTAEFARTRLEVLDSGLASFQAFGAAFAWARRVRYFVPESKISTRDLANPGVTLALNMRNNRGAKTTPCILNPGGFLIQSHVQPLAMTPAYTRIQQANLNDRCTVFMPSRMYAYSPLGKSPLGKSWRLPPLESVCSPPNGECIYIYIYMYM